MEKLKENEFGIALVAATTAVVGRRALNHKLAARCEFGDTVDACMEVGLSPVAFDCSGLVIHSLCTVLGTPTAAWARERRHVRQMYDLREAATKHDFLPGNLAIFGAYRDIDNVSRLVPTHIGVILANDVATQTITMVHAHTYRRQVVVEPVSLNTSSPEKFMDIVNPLILAEAALQEKLAA